jgi:serine/threonine-protein phosphatase 6 regulatory subunit 3
LESKSSSLQEHILRDCDFVGKIIQAEKHLTLEAGTNKVEISSTLSPKTLYQLE